MSDINKFNSGITAIANVQTFEGDYVTSIIGLLMGVSLGAVASYTVIEGIKGIASITTTEATQEKEIPGNVIQIAIYTCGMGVGGILGMNKIKLLAEYLD